MKENDLEYVPYQNQSNYTNFTIDASKPLTTYKANGKYIYDPLVIFIVVDSKNMRFI